MQGLAGAENTMGGLQQEAWDYNTNQPYQIKLNMANEQKQAGMANLFGGLGDISSTVMNFVGTKYYSDAIGADNPNSPFNIAQRNKQIRQDNRIVRKNGII
jgi:hypothetical protein